MRGKMIFDHLSSEGVLDSSLNSERLEHIIQVYFSDTSNEDILGKVKDVYRNVTKIDKQFFRYGYHLRYGKDLRIPIRIAEIIMSDSREYPWIVTAIAEKSCRDNANSILIPVGTTAVMNGWFD
jgi:hypothetical protein